MPDTDDPALWYTLNRLITNYWADVDNNGGSDAHQFYLPEALYTVGGNRFEGAEKIQDGAIVGEHRRRFGRGETIYDPWHYVPVLARKPGALRNGAPFKDWLLPASLERLRRKLQGSDDGDRQMVKVLSAVLTDGLAAVETACAEALADGVHSADVVLNILSRRRDPGPLATILTPDALRLGHLPTADCARYDSLRKAS
jgi:hypothetical protein